MRATTRHSPRGKARVISLRLLVLYAIILRQLLLGLPTQTKSRGNRGRGGTIKPEARLLWWRLGNKFVELSLSSPALSHMNDIFQFNDSENSAFSYI